MMDTAKYEDLRIADCLPTGDNPRQVNEESERFRVLAASVKAEGVKEPIRVRRHPDKKGKYDCRDGARRLRAAELAGLKVIPALVYEQMTDIEAFEMTLVPFLGREDLAPIEEAKAVSVYLDKHGGDTKAVADKLGQTERWVKLRANVFENLDREWIEAVEINDGGDFSTWTISHLELMARFDKATQKRLLEKVSPWDVQTLKELSRWCDEQLRRLSHAPWKMDDALADAAGEGLPVCSECPKRTSRQALLWEEADGKAGDDRCLDAVCFEAKQAAVVRRNAETWKAQHPNLVLIGTGGKTERLSYTQRKTLREQFPEAKLEGEWETAKKSDPDAVPCLVLAGKAAGNLQWKKRPKKASADRPGKAGSGTGVKSMQEKKDELGRKRWQQVLRDLHQQVARSGLDAIVYPDKATAILLLVWQFGTCGGVWLKNNLETVRRTSCQDDLAAVLEEIWSKGVRPEILSFVHYGGPITQTPDSKIAAAGQVGKLLGIDVDALLEKACRDIPAPKSWSKPAPQTARK
jgi:ParB/RepB/Spo0J family partition protein